MQRLIGDLPGGPDQATALDDLEAALLAEVVAAQAAALAVLAIAGGHAQAREQEALGVAQLGAGRVQVGLLDQAQAQAGLPVHQAAVLGHAGRFGSEQAKAVGEVGHGLVEVGRNVVVACAGHRLLAQVQQVVPGDLPGQRLGVLQGALQAGLGQVGGGGIGFHAIHPHGEHGALVLAEEGWFRDVAANRQRLVRLFHMAQGKQLGRTAQRGKALAQQGAGIEHVEASVYTVAPP
ncbi:hypothetical protein D3C78_878410 [compost metagenome]